MNQRILTLVAVTIVALASATSSQADEQKPGRAGKVYGEWLIRPKPDKGPEYNRLIEQKGLPLFREAGGRMVGWWNTLIGNLYEHVTIWEYDDMAAFQKAVEHLGKSAAFKKFVGLRDPLLAGEDSRFLKLAPFAEPPALAEPAPYVIHEIHRVPLPRMEAYLKFMEKDGLRLLKKHGFRPVGPWVTSVGKWSEVTYLFRFKSLAERDQLIADFSSHEDGRTYGKVMELVSEITTRLLLPAPFAKSEAREGSRRPSSKLLPHLEEVAPGVFAAGFADKFRSANCGWVALQDHTLLIDLPRGLAVADYLGEVARLAGKPPRTLLLTRREPDDAPIIKALREHGVKQATTADDPGQVRLLSFDDVLGKPCTAVFLPGHGVLFGGPLVVNGPRTRLPGTDTALWLESLRKLEKLDAAHVVPGFGSWSGPEVLTRQRQFLTELRRQVGYYIARGRPAAGLHDEIRALDRLRAWMPYDYPTAEDFDHLYLEMTVPHAPFNGREPNRSDPKPHALVLIGDEPHEPGHIEAGLRPAFEAAGIVPHFTVDVRALTAENLAKVPLLVILRDGLQRPRTGPKSDYVWMTPEQERAVVQFVESGGAFLNLHNSMGLYPAGGPYLKLVGGRYIGHGPLERFRVEVVDAAHPITRGVHDFTVADEQHTPPYDESKVHLLLRSRSDEGKTAAAGWAYEPGKGRLVHLAPGHTREALLHPDYQLLLKNAMDWCLRRP